VVALHLISLCGFNCLSTVLLQNFFRSYPKLAGMTGTASTESAEFSSTYDLAVTVVPTNKVQHCPLRVYLHVRNDSMQQSSWRMRQNAVHAHIYWQIPSALS
jgi:SecA DEAD-like domain